MAFGAPQDRPHQKRWNENGGRSNDSLAPNLKNYMKQNSTKAMIVSIKTPALLIALCCGLIGFAFSQKAGPVKSAQSESKKAQKIFVGDGLQYQVIVVLNISGTKVTGTIESSEYG